ncbi:hypothetical protein [Ilumatobacter sp.]|uniref:DUF5691 domain-containing protein n=1 Tax=Ilumatobacter sp. TaxID=1967498 RepID=UPI003B52326C
MRVDEHWRSLVTAALLGTDRRDPPDADGPLGDLVADAVREDPSARMLAQIAACTAVRRAAVRPGPVLERLVEAPPDDRPPCPPDAVDRWHHLTTSWPVLEDEWLLALIANGWRAAPELVAPMLRRHRREPRRRALVEVAAGPTAGWLVGHLPELAATRPGGAVDAETLAELPRLPIPPDLAEHVDRDGGRIADAIAEGLADRRLAEAHRAVLVNLLARCAPDGLVVIARRLDSIDPTVPGRGLASILADLAITRHRMLDELSRT